MLLIMSWSINASATRLWHRQWTLRFFSLRGQEFFKHGRLSLGGFLRVFPGSIESIDPGTRRQCGGKDDVRGQGGVNDLRRQMIEANKLPRSSHGSNMNGYMNGYPSWIVHGKSETKMDDDWGYPHVRKPPHVGRQVE